MKLMTSPALAFAIASRSEPGPLSLALVTTVFAYAGEAADKAITTKLPHRDFVDRVNDDLISNASRKLLTSIPTTGLRQAGVATG